MSVTTIKPTEAQKGWLARIFGPELWAELCDQPEFQRALDSSMANARRLALRHLAARHSSTGGLSRG
jgi:hypothetical protein